MQAWSSEEEVDVFGSQVTFKVCPAKQWAIAVSVLKLFSLLPWSEAKKFWNTHRCAIKGLQSTVYLTKVNLAKVLLLNGFKTFA